MIEFLVVEPVWNIDKHSCFVVLSLSTDLIDREKQCLPSAGKLFETITKPHFLEAESKAEIDWEKIISNKSHEDEIKCTNTNAVPPPQSYESQTPSLKPTLGDTTVITPNHKRPMGNEVEQESTGICSMLVCI